MMGGVAAIERWTERAIGMLDLAIAPGSVAPDVMRRIRILGIATALLVGVGLVYLARHWSIGPPEVCIALAATILVAIANLALLRMTLRPKLCAHIAIADLAVMLVYSNYTSGGFYDPNFSWLYLLPICAAVVLEVRGAALWTAATLGLCVAFWLLPDLGIELVNQIPEPLRRNQALFHRLTAIVAIGLIGVSFVTGQRRGERELALANEELFREKNYVQLLQHAAVAANEATSFEEAMQDSVLRICQTMDWTAGHICLVEDDGSIASSGFYHSSEPARFGPLAQLTLETTYRSGEGMPGRALATGLPQCVTDLSSREGMLPRADTAHSLGLHSAFAVPIFVHGQVRAVLEFASTSPLCHGERLMEVFGHIGVQLGRVAERTALHERLRQSQKLEAVGQLAAGLAHEINNPMSYVRSNLHLLRQDWDQISSKLDHSGDQQLLAHDLDECRELIDDSLDGVERTIAIVRDVKQLSHAGRAGTPEWAEAELAELMEGALRMTASQASPDVRFESEHEALPPLRCSPNQLRQVFVNLIVNAVQAVGASGTIRLVSGREGGDFFARIEDDGPGIAPETRERLFDPFFTTKPVGEGTGLGLYVSYEIVRRHGGEILVRSEQGAGTSFEVRLPQQAAV